MPESKSVVRAGATQPEAGLSFPQRLARIEGKLDTALKGMEPGEIANKVNNVVDELRVLCYRGNIHRDWLTHTLLDLAFCINIESGTGTARGAGKVLRQCCELAEELMSDMEAAFDNDDVLNKSHLATDAVRRAGKKHA